VKLHATSTGGDPLFAWRRNAATLLAVSQQSTHEKPAASKSCSCSAGVRASVRSDVALELARGRLAARDYSGALAAFEPSIAARQGKVSVGDLSLLLYLLGKGGRTDDARMLVATLDAKDDPDVGAFTDWFQSRFDAQASLPPANVPR